MKPLSREQALSKAAALCSSAEYCVADVLKKLTRWQVSEGDAAAIIAFLLKEKYIDEARFAKAFVHDKAVFSKWGPSKISMALRLKQIPTAVINTALEQLPANCFSSSVSGILQTKLRSLKYKDVYEAKAKLLRFGLSRGFAYDDLLPVVESLISSLH